MSSLDTPSAVFGVICALIFLGVCALVWWFWWWLMSKYEAPAWAIAAGFFWIGSSELNMILRYLGKSAKG